jgi:5'-nucleotidase
MQKIQILLTNDDGIKSPGLWAAAAALEEIGFVTVAAPRQQSSGTGRSLPSTSDGIITPEEVEINARTWKVYAIGGTPAQAVLHGALEIMPRKPDLIVSGINYGSNIGNGVTISGTVGAALEGAAMGIPSLAISLETAVEHHLSYSTKIDFSTAAFFTTYFGKRLLERKMPPDVHVLKVEVPAQATPETPWDVTRLSQVRFYEAIPPKRASWDQPLVIDYHIAKNWEQTGADTDAHSLHVRKNVSVTPLSLDLTSRLPLGDLDAILRDD